MSINSQPSGLSWFLIFCEWGKTYILHPICVHYELPAAEQDTQRWRTGSLRMNRTDNINKRVALCFLYIILHNHFYKWRITIAPPVCICLRVTCGRVVKLILWRHKPLYKWAQKWFISYLKNEEMISKWWKLKKPWWWLSG